MKRAVLTFLVFLGWWIASSMALSLVAALLGADDSPGSLVQATIAMVSLAIGITGAVGYYMERPKDKGHR